jgi:predicted heme/steroid binding protein
VRTLLNQLLHPRKRQESRNIGGSGTFTDNGGVTSPEGFAAELTSKLRTSATQVNCSAFNPDSGSEYFQCTATVADSSVAFSVQAGAGGGFQGSSTCQLQPSQSGPTAYCSVTYLPAGGTLATGTQPPITAAYQGDQTFAPSSSTPQSSVVTTTNPSDVTPTTDTTSTTSTTTTTTTPCDSGQVRAHAMPSDAPCSKYGIQVATLNELKGLNGPAGNAYIIHSDGTFEVASVGSPIYVGDTILTTQGTVGAIQFVLGGRVGINSDDGINVVNERSATEVNSTLDNVVNGTITPSGVIQHLKQMSQPVLIQTNGGVMGIKG